MKTRMLPHTCHGCSLWLEAKTHGDGASRRESRVEKKVTTLALLVSVQVFISPCRVFHFAVLNIPRHVRARV